MMKAAEKFAGTVIYDVLTAVDSLYNDVDEDQKIWKARSPMQCPDGCGSCCVLSRRPNPIVLRRIR